ncbi:MdBV-9, partial [Microplitis demolitor]
NILAMEELQPLNETMRSHWLNLLEMYNQVLQQVKSTQKYYNDLYFNESSNLKHLTQNDVSDTWLIDYASLQLDQNSNLFNKKFQKCIDTILHNIDKLKIILNKTYFKKSFNYVDRFNELVRYLNKIIEFLNTKEFKIDNVTLNKNVFLKPLEIIKKEASEKA